MATRDDFESGRSLRNSANPPAPAVVSIIIVQAHGNISNNPSQPSMSSSCAPIVLAKLFFLLPVTHIWLLLLLAPLLVYLVHPRLCIFFCREFQDQPYCRGSKPGLLALSS